MFPVLCGPVPANSPPEAETPLIVQGKYLESLGGHWGWWLQGIQTLALHEPTNRRMQLAAGLIISGCVSSF